MKEQEQASRLAAWLDQPAGTRPPEGLDPDVVEALYALNPELAPGPSLTADDILRGFDLGGAGAAGAAVVGGPTASAMPETPVSAAPESWGAANRVGGWMVLLATAATLLLVAIPAVQQSEPAPGVAAAPPAAVEVAAAQRTPDPIASVDDEPTADVAAVAKGTEARQVPVSGMTMEVTGQAGEGDAVADADAQVPDWKNAPDQGYAMQQGARFDGADTVIPEAEEALKARDADDAVATLDDLAEGQASGGLSYGAPMASAPAAEDYADLAAERAEGKKSSSPKPAAQRKEKAEPSAAPVVEVPSVEAPSSRDAARPRDLGTGWRAGQDAATLAEVDRALQIASTEASLGNPAKAAEALAPHVGPPAAVGQYVAGVAARYWLSAGNATAAATTLQRGLALSAENTPWRAQLLFLYGELLTAAGDGASAEAYWQEAAGLNASR